MYLTFYYKFLAFFPEVEMFDTQYVKNEINIKGFNSIYYFELGKDFTHPPEKHNFWEMVYVDKGSIIAITDDVGCKLEQGQAIFHEPNEVHSHISDNKVANNMLVISFTAEKQAMDFFAKKYFTLDKTSKTLLSLFLEEAKNALKEVPDKYEKKDNLDFSGSPFGSTQLLQCYFIEFLIHIIRNSNAFTNQISSDNHSRTIATNSLVELMKEYMEKNIYSMISLKDICQQFMRGKSLLSKVFKEQTGKSPMEYYHNLKISEAKKLIREERYSISEISDMLGYSSIHIFSRAFKKQVGFSPILYKKSILK